MIRSKPFFRSNQHLLLVFCTSTMATLLFIPRKVGNSTYKLVILDATCLNLWTIKVARFDKRPSSGSNLTEVLLVQIELYSLYWHHGI